ncbi:MAG: ankyrin repeat domain-containing protein, partial [Alphaproteobacteria bacterium]|nr:ankyrin repeat domain-containing protein [Alphaproteobacteria bacterium]
IRDRYQAQAEDFEIPSRFFIQSPIINWIDDFKNVIEAIEYWGVKRIPHTVFLFTIYHYSQGYKNVKELFPHFSIWKKLDIFVSYIEELNLVMDMVNLSASSRTVYPLMIRLAKHGFVDCIEFCLSLFRSDYREDKPETDYLLNSDIYISVLDSKLNTTRKIKAMEKLKDLGFPLCHTASIINTDPDCLAWLVNKGAQVDSSTLKEAITNDLENTIGFLLELGVQPDKEVMEHACYENKIRIVRMLIERGCPCNRNSFLRAIEHSNLNMVRMLLSYIPCEANEELIEKAIEFGHLECLKYLHRNGVPWSKEVYHILDIIRDNRNFTENHEACLMYLDENNCPRK